MSVGKGTPFRHRPEIYHVILKKGLSVEEAIKKIKKSPMIKFAQPNYYAHYAAQNTPPTVTPSVSHYIVQ